MDGIETIYEIVKSFGLPIFLLGVAYYFGTRELRKYQRNKDRNSNRESLIRELARFYTSEIDFLKSCVDINKMEREKVKTQDNPVLHATVILGLVKLYYKLEIALEFTNLLSEPLIHQGKELKKRKYSISEEEYLKYTTKWTEIYFQILDFIKMQKILP